MMGYCGASMMGYYDGLYLKVNWLLRSVYDGLLWSVYEWVTLVYGSYEHVPISYAVVTLLEANGYYRL